MGYIIFLFFASSPRRREIAYARYWAHSHGLLWAFFFTSSIICDILSSPRWSVSLFSKARSVSLFFTSAICEPFFYNCDLWVFSHTRDLWAFFYNCDLWVFFFISAICEPFSAAARSVSIFFQQQRDLWCFFSPMRSVNLFFSSSAICDATVLPSPIRVWHRLTRSSLPLTNDVFV